MKRITFPLLILLALGLSSGRAVLPFHFREGKVRKLLMANNWKLDSITEQLDGAFVTYPLLNGVAPYPNFLSEGRYIDKRSLLLDSAGNFQESLPNWARGTWSYHKGWLHIRATEFHHYYGNRIFGGDMKLLRISNGRLVLHKTIAADGSWSRTFYLSAHNL